jgi:hypothetical protein
MKTNAFRKKRFGAVKWKKMGKGTAVVFDKNERKEFLNGIYNARNRRKKHFEKKQKDEEQQARRKVNQKKRSLKKDLIEKFKGVGQLNENAKVNSKELTTKDNKKIIVKTSFLTD